MSSPHINCFESKSDQNHYVSDTSAKQRKIQLPMKQSDIVRKKNDDEDSNKKRFFFNYWKNRWWRQILFFLTFARKRYLVLLCFSCFLLAIKSIIFSTTSNITRNPDFNVSSPIKKRLRAIDIQSDPSIVTTGAIPFQSSNCPQPSELSSKNSYGCLRYNPLIDIQDYIKEDELFNPSSQLLQESSHLASIEVEVEEEQQQQKQQQQIEQIIQPELIQYVDEIILKHTKSTFSRLSPFNNLGILTRRGYKHGNTKVGINQDRSSIISPYFTPSTKSTATLVNNFFVAIWDGHGDDGHFFSHMVQEHLPILISNALLSHSEEMQSFSSKMLTSTSTSTSTSLLSGLTKMSDKYVEQALINSFLEMDSSLPTNKFGGCTSSIVLGIQSKLYFANVGDSQTFLISFVLPLSKTNKAANKNTSNTDDIHNFEIHIEFITKKHKPDMEEERERIERMGGTIQYPNFFDNTSRVIINRNIGQPDQTWSALAMSRSLGDSDGKAVGVISKPTVTVIDIDTIKEKYPNQKDERKRFYFVVAASDGVLDEISPNDIAKTVAESLQNGKNLHLACSQLIMTASQKWMNHGFFYRDDITIAVQQVY